jgi:hypothetical protein
MEAFGRTVFASALVVDGSSLRYEFRRAWFAGVPLPRRLAPVVDACADAGDTGWRLAVHLSAPYLGELVYYEGSVTCN